MIEVRTQHEWNTLLRTTHLFHGDLTIRIDEHDNSAPTVFAVPVSPRECVKPLVTPSWVTDHDGAVAYWSEVMQGREPKHPRKYGMFGDTLTPARPRRRRRLTEADFAAAD